MIDIRAVRKFFMGVLGWTPDVLMAKASLGDLTDAFEGYAEFHGLIPTVPALSRQFLNEMMKKFPDKEK